MPKCNFWIYPDGDHERNFAMHHEPFDPSRELPVVYVSFPGAKDPDFTNRHPGHSAIDVITVAPYSWFEQWEGTKWKKRGEDYEALKEQISQKILAKLIEHVPQVKEAIDIYELSTPLTTQHFCNYPKGEIYGIDHTPDRFRQKWLRPQTPIKNFYLTGQDICTAGVGGALFGGVLTAASITRRNLVSDIMRNARERRRAKA